MSFSESPRPLPLQSEAVSSAWQAWNRAFRSVAGCLVLLVCASGCASNSTSIPDERRHPQALDKLGAGDVVKVTYMGAKDQTQIVKIPPDGKVTLPYISSEVNMIGKTTTALQKVLTARCSDLANKSIVVTLQETSKRVYVSGTTKGGPSIPLDHPMTVSQVVAAAGGAPEAALARAVKLRCLEDGKVVTYSLHLLKDPRPVYVRPGDEIMVKTPQF